jgi:hypothetical protein
MTQFDGIKRIVAGVYSTVLGNPKWKSRLNNTPEKWSEFLRQTKGWLDCHPESRGIVTLNSWNEWVEGSYIEPDTVNGMKYLDAVRDVFTTTPVASRTANRRARAVFSERIDGLGSGDAQ